MPAPELSDLVVPVRTAVLVQEVQEGTLGAGAALSTLAAASEEAGLVGRIAGLLKSARASGVKVVHCTAQMLPGSFGANHNARLFGAARRLGLDEHGLGADGARPSAELDPDHADLVLPRYHGLSPLTGTQLDSLLRNDGITTLVVTGISLNVAIPNLVFDAVNRSYQVVVVSDAVVGVPAEYAAQVLRHTISLVATVATAEEVRSAWAS
jgi:nicotinamidase-related amidase